MVFRALCLVVVLSLSLTQARAETFSVNGERTLISFDLPAEQLANVSIDQFVGLPSGLEIALRDIAFNGNRRVLRYETKTADLLKAIDTVLTAQVVKEERARDRALWQAILSSQFYQEYAGDVREDGAINNWDLGTKQRSTHWVKRFKAMSWSVADVFNSAGDLVSPDLRLTDLGSTVARTRSDKRGIEVSLSNAGSGSVTSLVPLTLNISRDSLKVLPKELASAIRKLPSFRALKSARIGAIPGYKSYQGLTRSELHDRMLQRYQARQKH